MQARSLATYLADKEPIDLLRMDLEGYEVEILRSVDELPRSQTGRLKILFETHPEFYDPERNDMRAVLETCAADARTGSHGSFPIAITARDTCGRRVRTARIRTYGYGATHIVQQFRNRAIYANLRTADAIELICTSECVHAALLAPDEQGVGW